MSCHEIYLICFQMNAFTKRMKDLNSRIDQSNYASQKSALVNDLEEFLKKNFRSGLRVSSKELETATQMIW
jgi:predicted phage tail protein